MNSDSPTHEAIARRAREIWAERGQPKGRDEEIWFDAEREVTTPVAAENFSSPVDGRGHGNAQKPEPPVEKDGRDPTAQPDHQVQRAAAEVEMRRTKAGRPRNRASKLPSENATRLAPPHHPGLRTIGPDGGG